MNPLQCLTSKSAEQYWTVCPTPVFCAKTRRIDNNEKMFLNFATDDHLPPPKHLAEEELIQLIETSALGSYMIPVSIGNIAQWIWCHSSIFCTVIKFVFVFMNISNILGDPLETADKNGKACFCCYIVFNRSFYDKCVRDSELFKFYLTLVAVEDVKVKHGIKLESNCSLLKNRVFVGPAPRPMLILARPTPNIEELDDKVCVCKKVCSRSLFNFLMF